MKRDFCWGEEEFFEKKERLLGSFEEIAWFERKYGKVLRKINGMGMEEFLAK